MSSRALFGLRRFSTNVMKQANEKPKHQPLEVEQVYGLPTFRKIASHPFAWYKRFGSYTFGICFLANTISVPFNESTQRLFESHPQLMTAALLGKSFYFACLWPSFIPCVLWSPQKTLQLGGGVRLILADLESLQEAPWVKNK